MLIEIPDDKVVGVMKGLQDLCDMQMEYEDPAPGIGKTDNQFKWFEHVNSIVYKQVEHEVKVAFENAINNAVDDRFVELHKTFGIESGDVAPDLAIKYSEARDNLVNTCTQMLMHQM
jgi:hypothetical protein